MELGCPASLGGFHTPSSAAEITSPRTALKPVGWGANEAQHPWRLNPFIPLQGQAGSCRKAENRDLATDSTFYTSVHRSVCSFDLDAARPVRFLTKSFCYSPRVVWIYSDGLQRCGGVQARLEFLS